MASLFSSVQQNEGILSLWRTEQQHVLCAANSSSPLRLLQSVMESMWCLARLLKAYQSSNALVSPSFQISGKSLI